MNLYELRIEFADDRDDLIEEYVSFGSRPAILEAWEDHPDASRIVYVGRVA